MNVFELSALLTLNKKGFDEGLEDAESKSSGFGGKMAKAFGAVAKATGTALVATSGAVAGVVKKSVEAYADYEQLVGGVETLFGAGGKSLEEYASSQNKTVDEVRTEYESLMKAQSTVMSNASEAYKTAGLSANDYMETVTSFSASLISSVGGDTEKASEKANQAIIQMSDNANKMGTSMESIQNAYQGFAKQNYTMLDNLKLGYGGTKEEMQRLLEDATELSGVEYDISSYADIVDAIKVVQDEMGITGTTAKEASETISGSLGMMSASWQNLLTGLSDSNADMDGLMGDFIESVRTVGQNILPVVETALSNIGVLIEEMLPVIVDEIPALLNEVLPKLLTSASNIITTLVQGISQNVGNLTESAIDIVMALVNVIIENLPLLLTSAVQIIYELAMGISQALPELIPAIIDVVLTIVENLIDNVDMLIDGAIALVVGLAEGIIGALPKLIEKAPTIIIKLAQAIARNAPKLLQASIDLIMMLGKGLIDNLPDLIAKIPEIVDGVWSALEDGWKSISDIGRNLVEGLWNGIDNMVEWIKEKIKGFGSAVLEGIKAIFDVHSPSRKTAWIGKMLAEGLGQGWNSEAKNVLKDINSDMNLDGSIAISTRARKQNEAIKELTEAVNGLQMSFYGDMVDALGTMNLKWNDREIGRMVRRNAY